MIVEELQFEIENLQRKKFLLQLEQIFISKRLYQFIEKCRTWQEVLEIIMQKLQSFAKKLDRNITEQDIKYIVYKYNLITIENFIPQLIEKIRYIEETKVLSTYNFRLIPLKRNLYNMIQLRKMLKEKYYVFKQQECTQSIIDIKEQLDFVKYMFLLE